MKEGATIFKQGDDGDIMYILHEGECEINKNNDATKQHKSLHSSILLVHRTHCCLRGVGGVAWRAS